MRNERGPSGLVHGCWSRSQTLPPKWLGTWLLGSEQERALHAAGRAAIERTARDLRPAASDQDVDDFARVLDHVFQADVPVAPLEQHATILHQEGFLFSGTVLDNIRFGRPEATRAEVEAAARAVGADQVIAGLPDGYDTQVGERGALLAAGERQLVAFARAWIADPVLLLLDEATSNLDVASDARITDALRRLRSGRTTIIIAHRLSTIAQADQIAVIEDGRVVESGPPEELLARGGRFADLYGRWVAGAA